jgi:hypothetical protein
MTKTALDDPGTEGDQPDEGETDLSTTVVDKEGIISL